MAKKIIEKKLDEILDFMDVSPSVSVEQEDERFKIIIKGDGLSFLIGHRGTSLNALQSILALMVFKEKGDWEYVDIDINDYKEGRKEKLQDMVRNFIDRVRFHKEDVAMPSMNSYERRLIHIFVSDYPDIVSESTGEGRDRHVVLKLKEDY